jgi:glycerophosphoryl diester phosphodiesterase
MAASTSEVEMDKRMLAGIAAAAVAATAFASARAASEQGVLEGRAILPAETFAPGPPSGAFIGGPVINGVPVPFASQPVQGFSAVLPAGGHRFWVMEDNGYGAKANSSDFLLRMYLVTPQFKTAHGGSGSVSVGDSSSSAIPTRRSPLR